MTFNATTGHLPPVISNETADVKPAFRNAWKKRACLIVTAGRSRRNWFPESDFQTVGQQNLNVCTWRMLWKKASLDSRGRDSLDLRIGGFRHDGATG